VNAISLRERKKKRWSGSKEGYERAKSSLIHVFQISLGRMGHNFQKKRKGSIHQRKANVKARMDLHPPVQDAGREGENKRKKILLRKRDGVLLVEPVLVCSSNRDLRRQYKR